MYFCAHIGHVQIKAHVCRSEDNLWELVLSFHRGFSFDSRNLYSPFGFQRNQYCQGSAVFCVVWQMHLHDSWKEEMERLRAEATSEQCGRHRFQVTVHRSEPLLTDTGPWRSPNVHT